MKGTDFFNATPLESMFCWASPEVAREGSELNREAERAKVRTPTGRTMLARESAKAVLRTNMAAWAWRGELVERREID